LPYRVIDFALTDCCVAGSGLLLLQKALLSYRRRLSTAFSAAQQQQLALHMHKVVSDAEAFAVAVC